MACIVIFAESDTGLRQSEDQTPAYPYLRSCGAIRRHSVALADLRNAGGGKLQFGHPKFVFTGERLGG